jgi:hypothetical protein
MRLNESDIKKIIRKVISEGSFNNLKRRGGINISYKDILSSVIDDIVSNLENDGYDIPYYESDTIPDVVKPYIDEIVDAINFENLQSILWDAIVEYTYNLNEIYSITDKIREDLDQNS